MSGIKRLSELPAAKDAQNECVHRDKGACPRCANPLRFLRRFRSRHVIKHPKTLAEVHDMVEPRPAPEPQPLEG